MSEKLFLSDKERLQHDLEVWKVAMDTQMHFNDLLIKMRTTIISIILAVFGAFMIALKDSNLADPATIGKAKVFNIIIGIGIIFLIGQFCIDIFYYFRLLLGAVDFTEALDTKYKNNGAFGLSTSISKSIPKHLAYLFIVIYYLIPILSGFYLIWYINKHFITCF